MLAHCLMVERIMIKRFTFCRLNGVERLNNDPVIMPSRYSKVERLRAGSVMDVLHTLSEHMLQK